MDGGRGLVMLARWLQWWQAARRFESSWLSPGMMWSTSVAVMVQLGRPMRQILKKDVRARYWEGRYRHTV